MTTNEENLSEEDYLKKYLQETNVGNNNSNEDKTEITDAQQWDTGRATDLQFFAFDAKTFPLGIFYPEGTKILIRAAQVREIQAYSMVDDTNFYDIIEKMNDMLSNCVRIKYPDKDLPVSYLDLKDGDRYYAIFLIRELTFQKGNDLVSEVSCNCGETVKIEMRRNNFVIYEQPEKLADFFNQQTKKYELKTKTGSRFSIGIPNIGLQKSFSKYIIDEAKKKKISNMSFLKIVPFTISDKISITGEGIEKYLKEFQNMNETDFQFLNSVVNMLKFGIKEVKKSCHACGTEVHTDFTFPERASGIFIIQDAFDKFIQK
jgi:hypothetical protein